MSTETSRGTLRYAASLHSYRELLGKGPFTNASKRVDETTRSLPRNQIRILEHRHNYGSHWPQRASCSTPYCGWQHAVCGGGLRVMADHGQFGRGTCGGRQLTRRPFPTTTTTTTIEWTFLAGTEQAQATDNLPRSWWGADAWETGAISQEQTYETLR